MKEQLKRIAIEVPTIVLSVIIALGINEWNTTREREHLAANVVTAIREELTYNRAELTKAFAYHQPLVRSMRNGTHRMFAVPNSVIGIRSLDVRHISERLTLLLQAKEVPLDGPLLVRRTADSLFATRAWGMELKLRLTRDSLIVFGKGNISLHSALIRNNAWRIAQAAQIAPYLDFGLISRMSEVDQLHVEYERTVGRIVEMLYRGGSDVTPALEDMLYYETKLLNTYTQLDSLIQP